MKEYQSTITITFDGNNLEAESEEDYIQKLKDQFHEDFEINLENDEIRIHGSKEQERYLELKTKAINTFFEKSNGWQIQKIIDQNLNVEELAEYDNIRYDLEEQIKSNYKKHHKDFIRNIDDYESAIKQNPYMDFVNDLLKYKIMYKNELHDILRFVEF